MKRLKGLNPCDYERRVRESGTLRQAWEDASRSDLRWLIGKASLPHARIVRLAVDCASVVAHLMPDESREVLADLLWWAETGEGDTQEIRRRAYAIYAADAAYATYAAYAAYATYAAYAAADADAYAADDADAYAAYAAAAADDADDAYAYAGGAYAGGDILRLHITLEEVCAALDLDPDEVLS